MSWTWKPICVFYYSRRIFFVSCDFMILWTRSIIFVYMGFLVSSLLCWLIVLKFRIYSYLIRFSFCSLFTSDCLVYFDFGFTTVSPSGTPGSVRECVLDVHTHLTAVVLESHTLTPLQDFLLLDNFSLGWV